MKVFILAVMLSAGAVFGQAPSTSSTTKPEILSDQDLGTKFVSVIQATKIEDQLIQSSEFAECAKTAKFDPTAKREKLEEGLDSTAAANLQKCFADKLKGKQPEELQKLSATLNLKGFQLIRSQSVQEITNFLSNRLYKKLTGIDLDEKDVKKKLDQMKFSNRKVMVDQKDFVELYRIELGKSALYEISRFCFNNLRRSGISGSSFLEHWTGTNGELPYQLIQNDKSKYENLDDLGIPEFGSFKGGSDKSKIYTEIKDSFGSLDPQKAKYFFEECMLTITPLCASYRSLVASTGNTPASAPKSSRGANACLTQNRLQEMRKAMKNTGIVLKDFEALSTGTFVKIDNAPAAYDSKNAESGYNAVSTLTSDDFLQGSDTNKTKIEDCSKGNPDPEACKGFAIEDDSYKKALHDTEVNLTLRGEIELENLRGLKKDSGKLTEYLEKNGYFELLQSLKKNPTMDEDAFAKEVKNFFDAQRFAALDAIKNKVGKRQVEKSSSDDEKKKALENNVTTSKEEKSRLAQVVLFTNIVTSSLELRRTDGKGNVTVLGTNTSGLNKELSSISGIDSSLFKGFKAPAGSGGETANNSDNYLQDISFLDQVLGKQEPPASGKAP